MIFRFWKGEGVAVNVFHIPLSLYFTLHLSMWCFDHERLVGNSVQFFPTVFHPAVFLTSLALGTVTHLDLSWNDLGVEGGKAILDGMQAWSQLCVTGGKMMRVGICLLSSSQYMYICCCLIYLDHLDSLGALVKL